VDDPFWIDLGAAFDTLNLRAAVAPGVLSPAQDAANVNIASDTVSGFAVNGIAIEVPIALLTSTGAVEAPTSPAATIGTWATTSRPRVTVRRSPLSAQSSGVFHQVQRMGNPLINELLIGTGYKDRFSIAWITRRTTASSRRSSPIPRSPASSTPPPVGCSRSRRRRGSICCRW
jgi:hypothetical protein